MKTTNDLTFLSDNECTTLFACAILGDFSEALLTAISERTTTDLSHLEQLGFVSRREDSTVYPYCIDAELQNSIAQYIKAHDNERYRHYREFAFRHFLNEMELKTGHSADWAEKNMIIQLEALFLCLIDDNKLAELGEILELVSKHEIHNRFHQQLLCYFHAALSRELSVDSNAEEKFLALINQPGLSRYVAARAYNGLGILYDYARFR